jgi:hypothetical protein
MSSGSRVAVKDSPGFLIPLVFKEPVESLKFLWTSASDRERLFFPELSGDLEDRTSSSYIVGQIDRR